MEKLQRYFDAMLADTPTDFHRYLWNKIDWSERMIGLKGPRGIGKTTLLLQYAKEKLDRNTTLFVNAEDLYFSSHTLVDLADEFVRYGGEVFMIDEVHKYENWSRELKLIYDYHTQLKVIFTGSSILDIEHGEADLSRRVVAYDMQGLSFREYLSFNHIAEIPVTTLNQIIEHKAQVPDGFHPYVYFKEYLKTGYYPFSKEPNFEQKLMQAITKTLEIDIPQYTEMNVANIRKMKHLLSIVSESVPFKPNMTSIAQILEVSRNIIPEWLTYMERAGLIAQLRNDTDGIRSLGKVDKVYLDNPNIMYVLGKEYVDIGNIRETFFFNQTRVNHEARTSIEADFKLGEITFEVGGKNKKQKQIAKVENAFVVKDDIETGFLNVIPLWEFGLLY